MIVEVVLTLCNKSASALFFMPIFCIDVCYNKSGCDTDGKEEKID